MIGTEIIVAGLRIALVLILISAAFLLTSRNLPALVRTYSMQSFILVIIALMVAWLDEQVLIAFVALLTLVSKVIGIPAFILHIQKKIRIEQDTGFYGLKPAGALAVSILLIIMVYLCFSKILNTMYTENSLFFLGSVAGVSLMLMGLIGIFSRKLAITKVTSYLSMENGVLLFGLFATELPFIVEFIIMVDLIILILLTTILTVGMDSSIEEYTSRLSEFHLWSREEEEA